MHIRFIAGSASNIDDVRIDKHNSRLNAGPTVRNRVFPLILALSDCNVPTVVTSYIAVSVIVSRPAVFIVRL